MSRGPVFFTLPRPRGGRRQSTGPPVDSASRWRVQSTLSSLPQAGAQPQRLLVVANRLPVSAYKDKEGRWQFEVRPRLSQAEALSFSKLSRGRGLHRPLVASTSQESC